MASSDYKKFNREVRGYVEVLYDFKETSNTNIYTNLFISRNPNYTYNYSIPQFEYSQSLNDFPFSLLNEVKRKPKQFFTS